MGVFAFDEANNIVSHTLFEKNPKEVAERILKFSNGEDLEELRSLKIKLRDYDIVEKEPNPGSEYLKQHFREIAERLKFSKSDSELNSFMSSVNVELSRLKISKIERRDKLIVQTVSALNDLDKIVNSMTERLREWYGLHYPELRISDPEKFVKEIMEKGHRSRFEDPPESMGMELGEDDLKTIKDYAEQLKALYALRKSLEKYLERVVPEEMPNTNALLGSVLTAKLLAKVGSMDKLAKMASSSIQLIGAEKSLFKYLKERDRTKGPPRFGLLFLHPDISGSKREIQGKIARLLSSKLTLAVRADFYTKKNMTKELLEDYKNKLEQIKKGS